jgi:hypothetical protein
MQAGGSNEDPARTAAEDARMEDTYERYVMAPNHVALLQKVYDAARKVAANPDSQLAGTAARRLIAAFHGDVYRDETWLRGVSPSGTA